MARRCSLDEGFGVVGHRLEGFQVGLGGVQVELMKDVIFRVSPLTDLDAQQMLRGIRGAALLDGSRGAPPAHHPALQAAIQRL